LRGINKRYSVLSIRLANSNFHLSINIWFILNILCFAEFGFSALSFFEIFFFHKGKRQKLPYNIFHLSTIHFPSAPFPEWKTPHPLPWNFPVPPTYSWVSALCFVSLTLFSFFCSSVNVRDADTDTNGWPCVCFGLYERISRAELHWNKWINFEKYIFR